MIDKLNSLPSNWNEVTLNQYLKLIEILPSEEDFSDESNTLDIPLMIISSLIDVDLSLLEELKLSEVLPLVNKLSFIYTAPEVAKIEYKCKGIEDISYDEFVTWMQLKDEPYKNIDKLLPVFFPELKDQDLNQLSITIINGCFFLLTQNLKKHLKSSQLSLSWKIIKLKSKEKLQKMNPFKGKAQ